MNRFRSSAIIALVLVSWITTPISAGHQSWMKKTRPPTTMAQMMTTTVPLVTTTAPVLTTTVRPTVAELETTRHKYPIGKQTTTLELLTTTVIPTVADLDTPRQHYLVKKQRTTQPPTTTAVPTVAELETTKHHQYLLKKRTTTEAPLTTTAVPTVAELETTKHPYPLKNLNKREHRPKNPEKKKMTTAPPTTTTTTTGVPTVAELETTQAMIETTKKNDIVETTRTEIEKTIAPTVAPKKHNRRPKVKPNLPKVDFKCHHKVDGYYPEPKDKCSSHYYACVGGLARKLQCGAGDLVFEPETGTCERRHESFRCTGTRKTTPMTTPLAPPPPTPASLPIDCSTKEDGWYADPLKKCSHVFYSCANAGGSKFDCPGQMYFDDLSKMCLPYRDVEACAGKKPPTKPPKPTTPAPPKEKLPIDCTDKESGHYEDPAKKCSDIYYVCSNGDGFKRTCPENTYFDAKKQLCDYKDEVPACNKGKTKGTPIVPLTPATDAPVPSVASLPNKEYNCTGKEDRAYLPQDKKCSSNYFRCVGGITYKMHCQRGLFYDMKNDLCERWANLFECSGKHPTSPPPTTPSTKPPVTEKLPIDCTKYPDGDYPDPDKKCSSTYYSCVGLGGLRRQCPMLTYYDRELGICDIRENVMDCVGKPRRKTPKPTPRKPLYVTKHPYSCEKLSDGNFPAGKCESKYWSCVGGDTLKMHCVKGLYYDSENDECGRKEEIPACGGVRPTSAPNVIMTTEP